MGEVTSYTAERMQQIEDAAVIDGNIVGDDLVLVRFDGSTILAGNVRGPQGPAGSTGDTAILVVTSTTRPASPFQGLVIYETDTNRFYSWSGTAWEYRGGTIICTSTTLPANPFEGLSIYVTDTDRHYVWNGVMWVFTDGIVICTSLTRPTINIFEGLPIYETNTNKFLIYDGSAWSLPRNIAGGVLGYIERTTSVFNIPTTGTDLLTLPAITVPAGRYIRITGQGIFALTGSATDAIGTINEGATELQRFAQMSTSLNQSMGAVILTPSAGAHTYKLRAYGVGGMINFEAAATRPGFILVEDIGGV